MQQRRATIVGLAFLYCAVLGFADDKAKTKETKKATIKITLPDVTYKPTILKIEGKEVTLNGDTKVIETPPLEVGKEFTYKIEAIIEPNNYTKISRVKEINFKPGDTVDVDLRKSSPDTDKDIIVRWVPTPDDVVDEMCKLAKVTKDDIIYDPGCGDAVMLRRPIKLFGAQKGIGIDIDPEMVAKAKKAVKEDGLEDKIVIRQGNILKEEDMPDLKESTVVLLYIGTDLNLRIKPLLLKHLKPGTRIVSHRFEMGDDMKPEKTVEVTGQDGDRYYLHLWIVPDKKK